MKITGSIDIPRHTRNLLSGILLTVPAYAPAATDADLEAVRDQMQHEWFYTEVVIFQRPAVMEFLSEEALVTRGAGGFPSALETFLPGPEGLQQGYLLEPAADGCQAFERSDQFVRDPQVSDSQSDTDEGGAIDASAQPLEEEAQKAVELLPVPPARPRLSPDPVVDFLGAVAEFEAGLAAQNPALLAPDRLTMRQEAARIQGDRRYQVLWHGGWLQPIPARKAPAPMLLQTGHRSGERYQLEGFIDVTLGRYLHFHTRLFYSEPLLGAVPVQNPLTPAAAVSADTVDPADPYVQSDQAELASSLNPARPPYMVMEESRRVRSGELHYLDHPKLGVLVRIEPVAVPDVLVDAYLALQEDPE
jgi:hypothetical protein